MENKDLQVLFEDNQIIVVVKPQNIPSQKDASEDEDMLSIVKSYIKEKYKKPGNVFLGLVHRLDRPTGGVMVFARTSKSAERLCEAIKDGNFEKKYLLITNGIFKEKNGYLEHYLKKNSINNTVYCVPQATEGAKHAKLHYNVLEEKGNYSLVEVKLLTGRGHQIRVQMSAVGHALLNDAKYGNSEQKGKLCLWSTEIKFNHPVSKEKMTFVAYPPDDKMPWSAFDIERFLNFAGASGEDYDI